MTEVPDRFELVNVHVTPPTEIPASPDNPATVKAEVGTVHYEDARVNPDKRAKSGDLKPGQSKTFKAPHTVVGIGESARVSVRRPPLPVSDSARWNASNFADGAEV
jgi:hypothetical protein